jgi:predicted amidohydrolase
MKICLAQTKSVVGDVQQNISNHKKMAESAVLHGVEMIIFPELSLTGYEPGLANELATTKDDVRLNILQQLSDEKNMIIGAGMPIRSDKGILIGMIIFQPQRPRQTYFKQYLHPDEEPYFINGPYQKVLEEVSEKLALAVCYEISVPEHAEQAHKNGADIYIASVAKTVDGVNKAMDTLSDIAKKYSMTMLLSNCVGECEGKEAGGRSSVWNNKGVLLEQLNDTDEGMLIFDTKTQEVIKEQKKYSIY